MDARSRLRLGYTVPTTEQGDKEDRLPVWQSPPFPIVLWMGPSKQRFTREALARVADAGFNVSLCRLDPDRTIEGLDIAAEVGVRLIVGVENVSCWEFPKVPGQFGPRWQGRLVELLHRVREHPGLYGHYLVDEPPNVDLLEELGEAARLVREHDPEHLPYVNHWAIHAGWFGARSYEDSLERLHAAVPCPIVSADLYPLYRIPEDPAERAAKAYLFEGMEGSALHFPRQGAAVHRTWFDMMDQLRWRAKIERAPLWLCQSITPSVSDDTALEELRYQVLIALAYGARGVQYFSGWDLLDRQSGTLTRYAEPVRAVNALVAAWAPVLWPLRSIGVYHHPADVLAARPLDQYVLGHPCDLYAQGGPFVIGHFLDTEDREHVLIVNRHPFERTEGAFQFATQDVQECSPTDGAWSPAALGQGGTVPLSLAPAGGRLFRFRREIPLADFAVEWRAKYGVESRAAYHPDAVTVSL